MSTKLILKKKKKEKEIEPPVALFLPVLPLVSGTVLNGTNLGGGEGVFAGLSSGVSVMDFRSLVGGTGIDFSGSTSDYIVINDISIPVNIEEEWDAFIIDGSSSPANLIYPFLTLAVTSLKVKIFIMSTMTEVFSTTLTYSKYIIKSAPNAIFTFSQDLVGTGVNEVTFVGGNFNGASSSGKTFKNCNFSFYNCSIFNINFFNENTDRTYVFENCTINQCRFTSNLKNVNASFTNCTITNDLYFNTTINNLTLNLFNNRFNGPITTPMVNVNGYFCGQIVGNFFNQKLEIISNDLETFTSNISNNRGPLFDCVLTSITKIKATINNNVFNSLLIQAGVGTAFRDSQIIGNTLSGDLIVYDCVLRSTVSENTVSGNIIIGKVTFINAESSISKNIATNLNFIHTLNCIINFNKVTNNLQLTTLTSSIVKGNISIDLSFGIATNCTFSCNVLSTGSCTSTTNCIILGNSPVLWTNALSSNYYVKDIINATPVIANSSSLFETKTSYDVMESKIIKGSSTILVENTTNTVTVKIPMKANIFNTGNKLNLTLTSIVQMGNTMIQYFNGFGNVWWESFFPEFITGQTPVMKMKYMSAISGGSSVITIASGVINLAAGNFLFNTQSLVLAGPLVIGNINTVSVTLAQNIIPWVNNLAITLKISALTGAAVNLQFIEFEITFI